MKLREVQKNFKKTIFVPDNIADENFSAQLLDKGVSIENRMKVYRNNVVSNLSNAVTATYPMVEKLVGKDFMTQAVRAYIIKNLPAEGNLNFYGGSFPAFLEDYEPVKHLPYLPDIARLEWAWEMSFYAANDKTLLPDELTDIPEQDLANVSLKPRDGVKLVSSPYPLDKIVDFCKAEDQAEKMDINKSETFIMVFRPEFAVGLRKISKDEYGFLSSMANGDTIEAAAQQIKGLDITATLRKHLMFGTFTSFSIKK